METPEPSLPEPPTHKQKLRALRCIRTFLGETQEAVTAVSKLTAAQMDAAIAEEIPEALVLPDRPARRVEIGDYIFNSDELLIRVAARIRKDRPDVNPYVYLAVSLLKCAPLCTVCVLLPFFRQSCSFKDQVTAMMKEAGANITASNAHLLQIDLGGGDERQVICLSQEVEGLTGLGPYDRIVGFSLTEEDIRPIPDVQPAPTSSGST